MSRKYRFGDSDELYFISYAVVYWIDVFVRKEYKDCVVDSWKYCQLHWFQGGFYISNDLTGQWEDIAAMYDIIVKTAKENRII